MFTVERCSPKTNWAISPIVKYMEQTGKVFTMNRCSLIRGIRYETFHCTIYLLPEFNIQHAVYQFVMQGSWTTRNMLMPMTLTHQADVSATTCIRM